MLIPADVPRLLTPREVAAIMRVKPKTVTRWSDQGKLKAIRVGPRGHRKYLESEVRALLDRTSN